MRNNLIFHMFSKKSNNTMSDTHSLSSEKNGKNRNKSIHAPQQMQIVAHQLDFNGEKIISKT